jgi:hypothetical protein
VAEIAGVSRISSDSRPGCHRVFRNARLDRAFSTDRIGPLIDNLFMIELPVSIALV